MGKTYKRPQNVPVPQGNGYPEKDMDLDDVPYYGRFVDAKKKKHSQMRGAGAATRGKRFLDL